MTTLTINGQPVSLALDPEMPLLWALREGANLTGTKYGCGTGECGACMVLADGEAVASCTLTLAQAEGRSVTTIEGLAGPAPHPVQTALHEHGAIQCGFCTPGIAVAAAALLARNAAPSEAEIKAALPNICRCGVYPRLVGAVQAAGRAMRNASPPAAMPVPGPAVPPAASPPTTIPATGLPVQGKSANAAPLSRGHGIA